MNILTFYLLIQDISASFIDKKKTFNVFEVAMSFTNEGQNAVNVLYLAYTRNRK